MQSLGEALIDLSNEQLESIGLDERLLDAVLAAKSFRAHGALRRQKQLIGKLMRDVDPEPIRAAIHAFSTSDRREKQVFREAEEWRDRITAGDAEALARFFDFVGRESAELVSEVSSLRSAVHDKARKSAKRRIFRLIHKEIELKVQNDTGSI